SPYITRAADHNFPTNGLSPNDPNYLLAYTSAFDMQSNTTNQLKLYLDWSPIPSVGLSFDGVWAEASYEGVWSKVDYDDVTLGRTKADKQGYFLSGNWNASDKLRFNAFGSWEEAKY